MREEGPNQNKKWCILKYFYAETSFEKSKINQAKRHVSVVS